MKYTIKLYNKWILPYYYTEPNNELCELENIDSYATTSFDLCKQIVKDFVDAPIAELSLKQIHEDFDYGNETISEQKAISILQYYNGRFAMLNTILLDLENIDLPKTLRYDIPEKYNKFSTDDDNEKSKQIEAYIEIKIEK